MYMEHQRNIFYFLTINVCLNVNDENSILKFLNLKDIFEERLNR